MGAQHDALLHVEDVIRREQTIARSRLDGVLARAGCAAASYVAAMECVRDHARVVVHFHPDRLGSGSISVAEALLRDGVYRNQFQTGLSSGSLSAFPGGARDTWERALFGGAYHQGARRRFAWRGGSRVWTGSWMPRRSDAPRPRFACGRMRGRTGVSRLTRCST